jgi:DNA (cytosine-5)-methyltransferase 1
MVAFYNEIDPYAAQWLRNLIAAGHIAPGVVDTRSIVDLTPADLAGFTQVHFFAGIGGWSLAARLAGWPDDRPLWTGSCPCQPFSVAGKGAGQEDVRHLWPEFHRLIAGCRPPVVMGEQVAAAVGKSWLDGVCSDLEGIGYACGAAVVPACAVDAPHRRDRLWFVADCDGAKQELRELRFQPTDGSDFRTTRNAERQKIDGTMVDDQGERRGEGRTESEFRSGRDATAGAGFWNPSELAIGADGKARRVKPGVRLLAHGVPARVGKLRAFGNAIVPAVAAEIIGAYLDCN